MIALRHRPFRAVEKLVLDEHDWVVVPDGRSQEAFRIGRCGRHYDLEAGYVGEPRLERLGVLRCVAPTRAALGTHDERHAGLTAEHEPVLSGLVDDLVDGETGEVDVHELDDRTEAGERGSDACPNDPELADRRLADTPRPELGEQAGGHLKRSAVLGDVLAHHQNPRVALHLESECVAECLRVEQLGHRALNSGSRRLSSWHRSPLA